MNKGVVNEAKLELLNQVTSLIVKGNDPRDFYLENKNKFEIISPFEVFSIFYFLDENLEISEIKEIAGKLVNLFRNGLNNFKWNKNISLIQKLLKESTAIKNKFTELKSYIKTKDYNKLKSNLNIIDELKKRFFKMQNVIFSQIEFKINNPKPLKVMWSLHDDAVDLYKQLMNELNNNDKNLNQTIGKFFFLVLGILEKEELLILPTLSHILSLSEFEKFEKEMDSYGYAFISEGVETNETYENTNDDYLFKSDNGMLMLDELVSILNCVGDITFVDSNNKVKFFNTPNKHFPRSSSIIGRDVRNCHPEKSIHIVNEIIDKFRKGEESRVDFWINFKSRLILISYFAIRNKNNKYLGVMELTQDITDIQKITGEKRILDFGK